MPLSFLFCLTILILNVDKVIKLRYYSYKGFNKNFISP